ncbi:hypothetical protein VYU27_004965 [Nannochloropsis oceanica]
MASNSNCPYTAAAAPPTPSINDEDIVPLKTLSRGVVQAYRGVVERVLPAFAALLQLDHSDGLSEAETEASTQRLKLLWLNSMKKRFGVDLGTMVMSDAPPPAEQRTRKGRKKGRRKKGGKREAEGGSGRDSEEESRNNNSGGSSDGSSSSDSGSSLEEEGEEKQEERRIRAIKASQLSRTFRWTSPPRPAGSSRRERIRQRHDVEGKEEGEEGDGRGVRLGRPRSYMAPPGLGAIATARSAAAAATAAPSPLPLSVHKGEGEKEGGREDRAGQRARRWRQKQHKAGSQKPSQTITNTDTIPPATDGEPYLPLGNPARQQQQQQRRRRIPSPGVIGTTSLLVPNSQTSPMELSSSSSPVEGQGGKRGKRSNTLLCPPVTSGRNSSDINSTSRSGSTPAFPHPPLPPPPISRPATKSLRRKAGEVGYCSSSSSSTSWRNGVTRPSLPPFFPSPLLPPLPHPPSLEQQQQQKQPLDVQALLQEDEDEDEDEEAAGAARAVGVAAVAAEIDYSALLLEEDESEGEGEEGKEEGHGCHGGAENREKLAIGGKEGGKEGEKEGGWKEEDDDLAILMATAGEMVDGDKDEEEEEEEDGEKKERMKKREGRKEEEEEEEEAEDVAEEGMDDDLAFLMGLGEIGDGGGGGREGGEEGWRGGRGLASPSHRWPPGVERGGGEEGGKEGEEGRKVPGIRGLKVDDLSEVALEMPVERKEDVRLYGILTRLVRSGRGGRDRGREGGREEGCWAVRLEDCFLLAPGREVLLERVDLVVKHDLD